MYTFDQLIARARTGKLDWMDLDEANAYITSMQEANASSISIWLVAQTESTITSLDATLTDIVRLVDESGKLAEIKATLVLARGQRKLPIKLTNFIPNFLGPEPCWDFTAMFSDKRSRDDYFSDVAFLVETASESNLYYLGLRGPSTPGAPA